MNIFAKLGAAFEAKDRKLFLVGGSVRDMVLGRDPKDLDFTTDALPDEIEKILAPIASALWDVGRDFGTIAAQVDGEDVEITTFRFDGPGRKPQVTFTDSLDEDLQRRDFTINAMALQVVGDGLEGMNPDGTRNGSFGFHNRDNLIDPFGGFPHLRDAILDTPMAPERSFGEDPLRMMRAARFVSQLGFGVSSRVRLTMQGMAGLIETISAERIAVELDKLLMGREPEKGLALLQEAGILQIVAPQLAHAHVGRFDDVRLRWASALSRVHPENVTARLRALKFSNDRVKDVSKLVELVAKWGPVSSWQDGTIRRLVASAGPLRDDLLLMLGNPWLTDRIEDLMDREGGLKPFLNGKEIMAQLDAKGPIIGEAQEFLWNLRLDWGPLPLEDVQIALHKWFAESAQPAILN